MRDRESLTIFCWSYINWNIEWLDIWISFICYREALSKPQIWGGFCQLYCLVVIYQWYVLCVYQNASGLWGNLYWRGMTWHLLQITIMTELCTDAIHAWNGWNARCSVGWHGGVWILTWETRAGGASQEIGVLLDFVGMRTMLVSSA